GAEEARGTGATVQPSGIGWQTCARNCRGNPRTGNGTKTLALRNRNAVATRAKHFRGLSARPETNRGSPARRLVENGRHRPVRRGRVPLHRRPTVAFFEDRWRNGAARSDRTKNHRPT